MIHSGNVAYHEALAPLMVPIDSIQRHPENYNEGDIDLIDESMEINGMYRPVEVQASTGYILAGNHTWETCVGRGAEVIPAVMLDVDDDTAIRIMAGDNEIARKARRNNTALLALLDRLKPEIGLLGTGLTPHDVEVMTQLEKIPLDYDEFGTWPTLTIRVPPHVKRAFFDMTEGAEGERERLEVLLRMAGWEG